MGRQTSPGHLRVIGGLVAGLLALTGCGTQESQKTAGAGFDEEAVRAAFVDGAEEMGLPGAYLLLVSGGDELSIAHGATELGGDVEPTDDTHVRVGSNTKTWTGTVVLELVDEDRLGLDDPVSDHLDVDLGEDVTIRTLLSMRSGVGNYSATKELNVVLDADPQRAWKPRELVDLGLAQPKAFAPDEGYLYSNTNTVMLGMIIEEIEDEPLGDVFDERLFEPLGMTDTKLPSIDDATLPEPFARGYSFGTNMATRDGSAALSDDEQRQFLAGDLAPDDHTFDNPSWGGAAGAGISTARDLATWVEALTDGSLLSAQTQKERLDLRPQSDDAPAGAPTYGLAIADFAGHLGHTGELPGYNTFMARNPESDTTLIIWANLAPTGDGLDPATTLARSVIESMQG